jgi:predicted DNA-binding protein
MQKELHPLVAAVLARIDALAAKSGRAESTISREVFGAGKTYQQLRDGADVWVSTLARAHQRLDELERRAGRPKP